MKAVVQDTYGSPNVLELRDIDKPEIGDDEVLVRVHAAGVDRGGLSSSGSSTPLLRSLAPWRAFSPSLGQATQDGGACHQHEEEHQQEDQTYR
jgi:hypothetical protein